MTTSENKEQGGGIYLYGVVEGKTDGLNGIMGIEDKPLRTVTYQDLQAIVSDLEEKPKARRDNLLRHAEVLDKILKIKQVLPARFGLIPESDNDVIETLLKPQYQKFMDLLKKLQGKREVDLKVYWDQQKVLNDVAQSNDQIRQLRDALEKKETKDQNVYQQKVHLGEMMYKDLEAMRSKIKEEAMSALGGLSSERKENDLQAENMVLNAAFLVPKDKEKEFEDKLKNIDDKFKGLLTFKVTPDAPPFNFVTTEISQQGAGR